MIAIQGVEVGMRAFCSDMRKSLEVDTIFRLLCTATAARVPELQLYPDFVKL
jgi:hypothetical protein